jgi:NAD(P)-dependent dehydrogenase (short-subunit alcohol dehydrogenase family)
MAETGEQARITTPFGRESTAAETIEGVDLRGSRAVVTGGAAGIGIETARALAGAGAEVTLAVRDAKQGATAAAEIASSTGNGAVQVVPLDLLDLESVRTFTSSWRGPLQILVCNAGVMALPELGHSPDGWELQFAINHMGHFELALGLHGALAAAGREGRARIVSVSSSAHLGSPVVFDDIHFERREYQPLLAYAQSKTANVLFAVEATRRWADDGIVANALMPGRIATGLQRHIDPEFLRQARERAGGGLPEKTPAQGAATSVLLAASPLLHGIGGRYFEDCNEALPAELGGGQSGVAAHALDPEAAERLWELSEAMLV